MWISHTNKCSFVFFSIYCDCFCQHFAVRGISPMMLIALFPAVNGYFFIPNYPTVVAAINFDRTGTTGIGKWILNHSFMMPGMVATLVSIVVGLLLIQVF